MFIHQNIRNLLGRAGVYLEENDGEGNDLGGSEEDKAKAAAAAKLLRSEEENREAEEAEAAERAKKGKQPTDEEARLLKEVMKNKEQRLQLKKDLDAATEKLKQFDGLDVDALKELAAKQRTAEDQQLEAKGEWERLKTRMAQEHQTATSTLETRVKELEASLAERESTINEMTVGSSFNNSQFITGETTLTPQKARVIFGGHFELEDGKVVGYDKPKGASNRTQLVNSSGDPVSFEDAMRKIIDADSDRDHLLKSGVKPGAKSTTTNVPGKVKASVGSDERSSADKISSGLAALMGNK